MAEVAAVKKYDGYRGWGPLMDDPDNLRERVCTEQEHCGDLGDGGVEALAVEAAALGVLAEDVEDAVDRHLVEVGPPLDLPQLGDVARQ